MRGFFGWTNKHGARVTPFLISVDRGRVGFSEIDMQQLPCEGLWESSGLGTVLFALVPCPPFPHHHHHHFP